MKGETKTGCRTFGEDKWKREKTAQQWKYITDQLARREKWKIQKQITKLAPG